MVGVHRANVPSALFAAVGVDDPAEERERLLALNLAKRLDLPFSDQLKQLTWLTAQGAVMSKIHRDAEREAATKGGFLEQYLNGDPVLPKAGRNKLISARVRDQHTADREDHLDKLPSMATANAARRRAEHVHGTVLIPAASAGAKDTLRLRVWRQAISNTAQVNDNIRGAARAAHNGNCTYCLVPETITHENATCARPELVNLRLKLAQRTGVTCTAGQFSEQTLIGIMGLDPSVGTNLTKQSAIEQFRAYLAAVHLVRARRSRSGD